MLVVLFLCNDVDRNNIKIGGYLLRKKIFIIIMVLNGIAAIIPVSMQRSGAVEIS